jgi:hypothetical protein
MKTLIVAVIFAFALIAAPAFTQLPPASSSVTVGGKTIGADPDANVRLRWPRDAGSDGI